MTIYSKGDHEGWQRYMKSVAQSISKITNGTYVLKGGTGLLFGYELPRHSTDLDFDSLVPIDISNALKIGAESVSGEIAYIRNAKNTETVQRFFIHLGKEATKEPLKIETSFRRQTLDFAKETTFKDNIVIYNIQILASEKLKTIIGHNNEPGRIKPRDLFDANFLFSKYPHAISSDIGFIVLDTMGTG